MEEKNSLFHEELVLIDFEVETREELLTGLSQILIDKGYVKETYTKGILEREKIFPTGLATEGVKVAIPHTDAKYVNIPAILIAKLKKPIVFKEMGTGTEDVEVSLVFMLAIDNPDNQLTTLSKLMGVFSNGETLKNIYESESSSKVIEMLNQIMSE